LGDLTGTATPGLVAVVEAFFFAATAGDFLACFETAGAAAWREAVDDFFGVRVAGSLADATEQTAARDVIATTLRSELLVE